MKVPTSTYRLQLNADFRLAHVRDLIPYFCDLGVSHLYLSPIFQARPNSPHGYDVTNPGQVNREIGDEAEFAALSDLLRAAGIGILLDIVPNHMAADAENPWWHDVLEHGPASLAARFFDIAWDAPGAGSRVILPVLGQELNAAVAAGELRIIERDGELLVSYFTRSFPIDPATYAFVLEGVNGAEPLLAAARDIGPRRAADADQKQRRRAAGLALKQRLRAWLAADPHHGQQLKEHLSLLQPRMLALLGAQAYVLEYWRTGARRLNYRRFFDVNDLAAVRVEDHDVFMTTHALTLELLRTDKIDGVRVDHVDGLRDPAGYLMQLRGAMADSYVVVEKILAPTEDLPEYWPIEGTTGYDFLGLLTGLFCHTEGLARLSESYVRRTGPSSFADIVYEKKKLVIEQLFAAELASLTELVATTTEAIGLHVERAAIELCLSELTAAMHVYRTYIDEEVDNYDRAVIKHAITTARHRAPHISDALFNLLRNLLVGEEVPDAAHAVRPRFVADWQQFTGPVTAKGLEDTAFYIYNRLIAQCEVGAQPDAQIASAAEFHSQISRRAQRWPYAMNASSTHDTKRSEDARARIAVLSEVADAWDDAVDRWLDMTQRFECTVDGVKVPTSNDKLLIFQSLVGVWPLTADLATLRFRLHDFLRKAAREAKTSSSWHDPKESYENALFAYVDALLQDAAFIADFQSFHERIAWYGCLSSLSQLTLKLGAPGVPDIYQGNESWTYRLVDPDNRGAPDYARLRDQLARLPREITPADAAAMLTEWRDGRIKLHVTRSGLHFRRSQRDLFLNGDYIPIEVRGRLADHVLAFARRHDDRWALILAARFYSSLLPRPLADVWSGTNLVLPSNAPVSWHSIFTGEITDGATLATVFRTLPFAILSAQA